ncbi:AmmeMemoRadiSam system protein B [Halocella sp. SP3-1]|uniref:AmmeMemoRadiSam system protein B n=1 Tax=Halocella sp. SP3-1 TaxID=2382161 RepID=UPI000F75BB58|nr:AmmeMemoRadiSam system protein B [Halocella sp. SP3-1]AZO96510.1 AmmeMemoRadiSam system protein B [Halocella sp. SP3-1]
MGILMAGLSPHPPLIIPEIGGERREGISKTINSLEELAEEVKDCQPDVLITISPHGPVFTDAISILDQEHLAGDFSEFGCSEVKLETSTDRDLIQEIRESSEINNIEVLTLSSAELEIYNYQGLLDHGVLIPLYFIQQAGLDVPLVPITMGLMEYDTLYSFGRIIQQVVDKLGQKAVIIASGDLSHRLKPGAPAGFNPRGEEFDRKIVEILANENFSKALKIEKGLIDKAGECGLRPLIIMLGALDGLSFKTEVKSYEGTFGVGYAVVGFYPGGDRQ